MVRVRPTQPGDQADRAYLFICQGPSCSERGGERLLADCRAALADSPIRLQVQLCPSGCLDSCATGPNALLAREAGLRTGLLAVDDLLAHLSAALEAGHPPDSHP